MLRSLLFGLIAFVIIAVLIIYMVIDGILVYAPGAEVPFKEWHEQCTVWLEDLVAWCRYCMDLL